MSSLTIFELFELIVNHPSAQKYLSSYNINIDKYISLLHVCSFSNFEIKNYNDYYVAIEEATPQLQNHLTLGEFINLVAARSTIDKLVFEIFQELTGEKVEQY